MPTPPVAYLDYNATAPLRPAVAAMLAGTAAVFGNPSSVHRAGRAARAVIEQAREALAAAIGARPRDIVFTSGGTEANALALRGLAQAMGTTRVLASAIEHPSVLAHVGADDLIPATPEGRIDLEQLARRLAAEPGPVMVAVMAANNETGVVQPVADVVALARRYGARVHCDAVQALGKMPLDLGDLGVDSISLSAHKIGGLKGAGALVLASNLEPVAQMVGGGQERRRRAGTENTLGIAAFGAVAAEVPTLLAEMSRLARLRDDLEQRLRQAVPAAVIHGAAAERLANTSCFSLPGCSSESQVIALDLAGIAVSAGAACSSGKVSASPVLLAMGVAPDLAQTAIRVSLGWDTTADDIDRLIAAWRTLALRAPLAAATST